MSKETSLSRKFDIGAWNYQGDGYDGYYICLRFLMRLQCPFYSTHIFFKWQHASFNSFKTYQELRQHLVEDHLETHYYIDNPSLKRDLVVAILDRLYLYFRDFTKKDGSKQNHEVYFISKLDIPLSLLKHIPWAAIHASKLYGQAPRRKRWKVKR